MSTNPSSRRFFLGRIGMACAAVGAVLGVGHQSLAQNKPRRRGGRRKSFAMPGNKLISRAVQFDRTIYLSGVVGGDANDRIDPDFELQAMRTMLNLKQSVERSGSALPKVLKCTCYLTRSRDAAKFNEVYAKFFPEAPPARTMVVVKELIAAGAMVQVDCVCHA